MPSNKRRKSNAEAGGPQSPAPHNLGPKRGHSTSSSSSSSPISSPRVHQVRRSKRQATAGSRVPSTQTPDFPHPMAADAAARTSDPADVMRRTREQLAAMEQRFQADAKKQRKAIEESELKLSPELDGPMFAPVPVSQRWLAWPRADAAPVAGAEGVTVLPQEAGPKPGTDDGGNRSGDDPDNPLVQSAPRPLQAYSSFLPLPWKGRLGYACLNTYLRTATPPVFCSRTCRLASILEHRHPLADSSAPEHPVRNRPDCTKPADPALGVAFLRRLGLANARDIPRMLRWNERYSIRFLRLSSEMFPFASHPVHGYRLAPFALDELAAAGRVAAALGHRITTHPGQFTQLGSPRAEVVDAAVRDLEYHHEMLSLLSLPAPLDRDAVVVIHMGGTFGDKAATLDRFRYNYRRRLADGIKKRLVLENDDVSWSVHDLLPVCEELEIPLVLDWHHHNIVHDASVREGTLDLMPLLPRIAATWTRKGITQKMHYSEPREGAVTARERRRHSARVHVLPPCNADMDLMIEAKDKEQAVFELMRTYKLPGWEKAKDMVPHEREDDERIVAGDGKQPRDRDKKARSEGPKRDRTSMMKLESILMADGGSHEDVAEAKATTTLAMAASDDDFAMGGPEGRVRWPEGKEEWLKPRKRERKAKADADKDVEEEGHDDGFRSDD